LLVSPFIWLILLVSGVVGAGVAEGVVSDGFVLDGGGVVVDGLTLPALVSVIVLGFALLVLSLLPEQAPSNTSAATAMGVFIMDILSGS
jgi:hypothetical protein